MVAAWPTTVIRSRWPRTFTRRTQKPLSLVVERDAIDEAGEVLAFRLRLSHRLSSRYAHRGQPNYLSPSGARATDARNEESPAKAELRHAAKVVAVCVPPVVMAMTGLALLSGKSWRKSAVAHGNAAPMIRGQDGWAGIGLSRQRGLAGAS